MNIFHHWKLAIIIIFFCTLLSGCFIWNEKKGLDISFSDASSLFANSMGNFYLKNINLLNTKGIDYHLFCYNDWWNHNTKLYWSIDLSWYETYTELENNFYKESIFDIYYQDQNKKNWNSFQWNLIFQKVWEDYFFKLSNWIIDLGTWNFEWKFVKLLIDSLWEKWIQYTPKFSWKTNEIYDIYMNILQFLRYWNLFDLVDDVTYEWNTAYQVKTSDIFSKTSDSFVWTFDVQWDLIVKSKNDIEFKFDDLQIYYNQKIYHIQWNIAGNHGDISIKENINSTKSTDISWQQKKSDLLINITSMDNFQKLWELDLNIWNFWKNVNPVLSYEINWTLKISPILIYWSDLENETKININCSYEKKSLIWDFSVTEPDTFILLDQILWDDFSIKSILWDTNFR